MTYPPAPWRLQGHAYQSVQGIETAKARRFIPDDLKIVPLWPGKTLGGLYLAAYGPGSTLVYHELIVVAGLVYKQGRIGAWISHIYVDNPDSVAGGREIWGLPKESARFTGFEGESGRIIVQQDERVLCTLAVGRRRGRLPLWFPLPTFGGLAAKRRFFWGHLTTRLGLAEACWEVPTESPFAALDLSRPRLTLSYDTLRLVAHLPRTIPS